MQHIASMCISLLFRKEGSTYSMTYKYQCRFVFVYYHAMIKLFFF
jgi:hypothetical protein